MQLKLLTVFHEKMHLNCFSICDRMRQKLLLPVWLANACVVVNFLSQVIFVFLLFLGMVMYANEIETKEK